ncbi:11814_t:CDS:2 [Acaulospora morrowiae]|uniref:11814_t:CDS:1 n=1 Tax=Acaulospora morrowiae TaxID=94023 RepID=A0A9N9GVL9_9GLOM|nr:11814_t:CDS:2 [Acaulospora morrowiae]
MSWYQTSITLNSKARGCHLVTSEILRQVPEIKNYKIGMANLFLQHTSASLCLNENADPDVRTDMEMGLNKLVPENWPYIHTAEGSDDMNDFRQNALYEFVGILWKPAHLKNALIGASLNIPITNGKLNMGTWQGIDHMHLEEELLSLYKVKKNKMIERALWMCPTITVLMLRVKRAIT